MRAALTRERASIGLVEVPEPGAPGKGEALVRPEVVGICGSDVHLFQGDFGPLFPRVQGHELSAIVEDVGPGGGRVAPGDRVAIWPVFACGECYPCRIGRGSACARIRILGVHVDGGLRDRLVLPMSQLFAVDGLDAETTALVEPVSIGVRTVRRARLERGERAVVLGAGPIGQGICLAAADLGASVLVVDPLRERRERALGLGAEQVAGTEGLDVAVRSWAGEDGPEVVVDATGRPEAIRAAAELVAAAGRVVLVGLSDEELALGISACVTKELDLLGVSCCSASEFGETVELVRRNREAVRGLVTHEFPLERVEDALLATVRDPRAALKVVVRMEG